MSRSNGQTPTSEIHVSLDESGGTLVIADATIADIASPGMLTDVLTKEFVDLFVDIARPLIREQVERQLGEIING